MYWRENIHQRKNLGITLEEYKAIPVLIPVDITEELFDSEQENF